ncbi:MAG TPA: threonine synthase [Puia sp.]|nr:threonine synthase [Puia sp.]
MYYYSLNGNAGKVDFRQAAISGQAPDKGLYFPEQIPKLPAGFISSLRQISPDEIALTVISPYVGDTISKHELADIVHETIDFDFPLVQISDSVFALELFHGPTLAFKDVGARFMSRCISHFVNDFSSPITVLVATSGDTGGAVASGFYGVEGVNVVILYPSGKVSDVQERQLTGLGKNITALEILGTFDDCQRMVKTAFADEDIAKKRFLTSANSINVARWLPQQFYYFFAARVWTLSRFFPVFCVPSGNFGNICAGILAHKSGLPAAHFIAACNANSVVPDFLRTGIYSPRKALTTVSNAMDVGDPSNFIRVLELFHRNFNSLKEILSSESISEADTLSTIKTVFETTGYVLDPHGAVGYRALGNWLRKNPGHAGIFLETAHPVKFFDVVEPLIGKKISRPPSIEELMLSKKQGLVINPDFGQLKDFLLS